MGKFCGSAFENSGFLPIAVLLGNGVLLLISMPIKLFYYSSEFSAVGVCCSNYLGGNGCRLLSTSLVHPGSIHVRAVRAFIDILPAVEVCVQCNLVNQSRPLQLAHLS